MCIRVWHLQPAFKANINPTGNLKWGRSEMSICSVVSAVKQVTVKQVTVWPLKCFSLEHGAELLA